MALVTQAPPSPVALPTNGVKRGPGRPKGSSNKPKTTQAPAMKKPVRKTAQVEGQNDGSTTPSSAPQVSRKDSDPSPNYTAEILAALESSEIERVSRLPRGLVDAILTIHQYTNGQAPPPG